MRILALDPGTEQTAFVVWDGCVIEAEILPNCLMIERIMLNSFGACDLMAYEMIASYGMPVGREVFETCVWIGRFVERTKLPTLRVYRKDAKLHLTGSQKAKDANVRMALMDLFGGKAKAMGNKKSPGPLYGIKSHLWAAMAVAIYAQETAGKEQEQAK